MRRQEHSVQVPCSPYVVTEEGHLTLITPADGAWCLSVTGAIRYVSHEECGICPWQGLKGDMAA